VGKLGFTEALLGLALLFLLFAEYFIAWVAKRVVRPRRAPRDKSVSDVRKVPVPSDDVDMQAAKEESGQTGP
jgi:hypothetical protein